MSESDAITRPALAGLPSLQRFSPEPESGVSFNFTDALQAAGNVATQAATQVVGLDPEYSRLLQLQIQVQQQMQLLSLESNVEKSKHETNMTAIRNVRVN